MLEHIANERRRFPKNKSLNKKTDVVSIYLKLFQSLVKRLFLRVGRSSVSCNEIHLPFLPLILFKIPPTFPT